MYHRRYAEPTARVPISSEHLEHGAERGYPGSTTANEQVQLLLACSNDDVGYILVPRIPTKG